jgi:hypothetical protein
MIHARGYIGVITWLHQDKDELISQSEPRENICKNLSRFAAPSKPLTSILYSYSQIFGGVNSLRYNIVSGLRQWSVEAAKEVLWIEA